MLTPDIIQALKTYTAEMANVVTLVMQEGSHPKREELHTFLTSFVSVSQNLQLVERDLGLRSPLSFAFEVDGQLNGIQFSGIPSGHEFNSLVLAVLHSSGTPVKLDPAIKTMLENIAQPLQFEVFVSLSCHNCPDVVQALNQFATLSEKVSSEMIDGALFPDLVAQKKISKVYPACIAMVNYLPAVKLMLGKLSRN